MKPFIVNRHDCGGPMARQRTALGGPRGANAPWRGRLRRELAALLALKVAALALLWWLFFSPAHHTPVDGEAASRRFAIVHSGAARPATATAASSQESPRD